MIKKITIKNFRSIKDMTIDFNRDQDGKFFLKLVGGNESGKSSILDAIDSISLKDKRSNSYAVTTKTKIEKDFEMKILVEQKEEIIKTLEDWCSNFKEKKEIEFKFILNTKYSLMERKIMHNSQICDHCGSGINSSTDLKYNFNSLFPTKIYKFDSNGDWKIFLNNQNQNLNKTNILKYALLKNGIEPSTKNFNEYGKLKNEMENQFKKLINPYFEDKNLECSIEIFGETPNDFQLEFNREMSNGENNFIDLLFFLEEVKKISNNEEKYQRNLVLIDEPEVNLDWKLKKELYKMLKKYNDYFDIITVTHDIKLLNFNENLDNSRLVIYDEKNQTQLQKIHHVSFTKDEKIIKNEGEFKNFVYFMGLDIYKENFRERKKVVYVEDYKMLILLRFIFDFYNEEKSIIDKYSFFVFYKNEKLSNEIYLNDENDCIYFLIDNDSSNKKIRIKLKEIEKELGLTKEKFSEYETQIEKIQKIEEQTWRKIKDVVSFIQKKWLRNKNV